MDHRRGGRGLSLEVHPTAPHDDVLLAGVAGEELAGKRHRRGDVAAAVAPEVENHRGRPAGEPALQRGHRVLAGVLAEAGHLEVEDGAEHPAVNGGDLEVLAGDGEGELRALAVDGERDRRPRRTVNAVGEVGQLVVQAGTEARHLARAHGDQHVAVAQPRPLGRLAVEHVLHRKLGGILPAGAEGRTRAHLLDGDPDAAAAVLVDGRGELPVLALGEVGAEAVAVGAVDRLHQGRLGRVGADSARHATEHVVVLDVLPRDLQRGLVEAPEARIDGGEGAAEGEVAKVGDQQPAEVEAEHADHRVAPEAGAGAGKPAAVRRRSRLRVHPRLRGRHAWRNRRTPRKLPKPPRAAPKASSSTTIAVRYRPSKVTPRKAWVLAWLSTNR